MVAANRGFIDLIYLLLQRGENVNARDKYGRSALFYAVSDNNYKTFVALLQAGADLDATNKDHRTVVMYAIRSGLSLRIKNLLRAVLEVDSGVGDRYAHLLFITIMYHEK